MKPGARVDDREMIAASETAKRNPMRPPDTLPRDGRSALKTFLSHPSPLMIAGFILVLGAVRAWLGAFGWMDLVVAAAIVAYFPFNEWLIHVFMLHYRPRKLLGRTIDFALPRSHRRHHADPWNLEWVFVPRHVHAATVPLALAVILVPWAGQGLALTALVTYLLLGLHYEWVHYLAHIPWCPDVGYYQRRVREHRYHHFRNENYWWGVSFGLGDRVLHTAPPVEDIGRSGTTSTLGFHR